MRASDCAGLYTENLIQYPILRILSARTKSCCLDLSSCLMLRKRPDLRHGCSLGTKGIMKNWHMELNVLSWPKGLLGFFHKVSLENPNELFGQPNNFCIFLSQTTYVYLFKNFTFKKMNKITRLFLPSGWSLSMALLSKFYYIVSNHLEWMEITFETRFNWLWFNL